MGIGTVEGAPMTNDKNGGPYSFKTGKRKIDEISKIGNGQLFRGALFR